MWQETWEMEKKMKKLHILTRYYGVTPTIVLRRNIFKARRVSIQHYSVTIHKDAKKVMEAIEKRFVGNVARRKTKRNLLKQQYENLTAPSSEMLDQTFDRLQKLVSQLELLEENISQEDVNQKLLRSLSPEWNTHGMSISSSSTQNMDFVSSSNNNTSSTNGAVNTDQVVNTANGVSTASTQVNAAYSTNIDNLSDVV
uniref:Uncharacterized protein n=1 Tax=Tanacetum cinerariifolium TaxID=118510 RepID=A0A6L2NRJ0_TANCI|nr:hypothetical protein [Tanacetum cinerariifolium]